VPLFEWETGLSGGRKQVAFLPFLPKIHGFLGDFGVFFAFFYLQDVKLC
jgi:hypothetical protein